MRPTLDGILRSAPTRSTRFVTQPWSRRHRSRLSTTARAACSTATTSASETPARSPSRSIRMPAARGSTRCSHRRRRRVASRWAPSARVRWRSTPSRSVSARCFARSGRCSAEARRSARSRSSTQLRGALAVRGDVPEQGTRSVHRGPGGASLRRPFAAADSAPVFTDALT
jgi:hypothetical protein